jgi:hypothetical protein
MWESGYPSFGKVLQELWGIAMGRSPTANNPRKSSSSGVCSGSITRTWEYTSITSISALLSPSPSGIFRAGHPKDLQILQQSHKC